LRNLTLLVGVIGNLSLLSYYKYSCLTGPAGSCGQVILPLAISFFTFQQIEFLLDTYHKKIGNQPFINYSLFVTFFPHLVAGPITRHSEMMPQFGKAHSAIAENIAIGLAIFAIGLGKKVFLADPLGAFASPIFASANSGDPIQFLPAWLAAVAFSLQLYFDFSGYSDMAIGISRMFGIRLPLNFDSPFRATNIVDFWKRWHLTLTRYINIHLYNPIVIYLARWISNYELVKVNSAISVLVCMAVPTIVVMTLAGIWHGAGIQFVLFGFMHGFLLATYNFWVWSERRFNIMASIRLGMPNGLSVLITFLFVVVSFVFFK
jgi:D-alanyl-lipoteichoic acid acyltransferase DltB (MBOAT superfamily)